MTPLNAASGVPEEEITLPKPSVVPELPTEGQPSWFKESIRISADGTCREVMLNEEAGAEAGKVWRFYPPEDNSHLIDLVMQLRNLPHFSEDTDLQESLNKLVSYSELWTVQDDFCSHLDRRNFLDAHPEVALYIDRISKLRTQKTNFVSQGISTLFYSIPGLARTPLLDIEYASRTATNEYVWFYDDPKPDFDPGEMRGYKTLTFENKRAFVRRIELEVVKYLEQVRDKISPSA